MSYRRVIQSTKKPFKISHIFASIASVSLFAMYGGTTLFGRDAGKILSETHADKQKILRQTGLYTERSVHSNPSQKL